MSEVRESSRDIWNGASKVDDEGFDVMECTGGKGGGVIVEITSRRGHGVMSVSSIFLDRKTIMSLASWLDRRTSGPDGLVCPPDCPGCGRPMIPHPFLGDWECHGCGWSLLRRM